MNKHDPHILSLPSQLTRDILSRLPMKTIISCKCVCKRWLQLLSSREFATSHLSRSTPGLIVNWTQIFEFDDSLQLQNHDLHYIPLLTFESPLPRAWIECSVNGLLCLNDNSLHIYNPITLDCISLPKLDPDDRLAEYTNIIKYGFGVSSSSCQYKVVRIFQSSTEKGTMPEVECMVYTLGTCSWRKIPPGGPFEYDVRPSNGTFLNGYLHWLAADSEEKQLISCLDLETELFEPFPPPPVPSYFPHNATLAAIDDCLWYCDSCSDDEIVVWVIKDYGVKESWVKQVVVSKELGNLGGLASYNTVFLLKVFKDGDILFLWEDTCLFYYSQRMQSAPEVGLFERDGTACFHAISHTPSFVSPRNFALEDVTWRRKQRRTQRQGA